MFQQKIGNPMGTNCAPLLADLFLHAYEAYFLQGFSRIKIKQISPDLLFQLLLCRLFFSQNNSRFVDFLHRIYPNELEVNDTTDIQMVA